jgi:hypothetical protein
LKGKNSYPSSRRGKFHITSIATNYYPDHGVRSYYYVINYIVEASRKAQWRRRQSLLLSIGVRFTVGGKRCYFHCSYAQRSTLNGRCWRFYAFDAAAVEIGYRNGWIERGDELTIAIAYNNQLSALEYSSRVDLRLFFRKKIVSNPHTQDGIRSVPFVLDVLHTQLWSIPLIATK